MKLVRPALGYISAADSRAILKRAVFMVFSKNWVYYRPPTEKEVEVLRLKWPRGDLLPDSCKHIIANFKAGGPVPVEYEENVAWEMEWLKECFRKHDHPQREEPQPAQSVTPFLTHFCLLMVTHLLLLLLRNPLMVFALQLPFLLSICLSSQSLSLKSTRTDMLGWRKRRQ